MFKRIIIIIVFGLISFSGFAQGEDISYGIHKVEQGETLYSISKQYYLSMKDIVDLNPGLTAENLKAEQIIKIPITYRNKAILEKATPEQEPKPREVEKAQETKTTESPGIIYQNPQQRESPKSNRTFSSRSSLKIAMILPLAYDKVHELDFNRYNISDKRKRNYQSFEYIGFYEGARIALNELEKQGYKVSLHVFDVGETDTQAMQSILEDKSLEKMDLIMPLVFRENFKLLMDYANDHRIPLINPMSRDISILKDNPYLFKIQPSPATEVESFVRYIKSNFTDPNVIILYTRNNSYLLDYYIQLIERANISWCGVDYARFPNRILEKADANKENIFISIVDRENRGLNEAYANEILSKLSKANRRYSSITVFGQFDWLDYQSIPLDAINKLNFHFSLSYLNDYTNKNFLDFVEVYREHFKAEPDKIYSAIGYDLMMYFVSGMTKRGDAFLDEPNHNEYSKLINPIFFARSNEESGYQNKRTVVYMVKDYKIVSVGR